MSHKKPQLPQLCRYVAVLLLAAGVISFVISLLVPAPRQVHSFVSVARGISTSPGQHRTIVITSNSASKQSEALSIRFNFSTSRFINNECLLQVGPPSHSIAVDISPLIDGTRYLVLTRNARISDLHPSTFVLLSHVRNARRYSVSISEGTNGSITVSVSGERVFSYEFSPIATALRPREIAVGSQLNGKQPFDGRISALEISMARTSVVNAASWQTGLRTGGLLVIVLGLVLLAIAQSILWKLSSALGPMALVNKLRNPLAAKERRKLVLVALALIVVGAVLLQYITPPSNVILNNTGEQRVVPRAVHVGEQTSYYLADEPQLLKRASAVDVDFSFDIRATRFPSGSGAVTVIRVGKSDELVRYFEISMSNNGFLVAQIPLVNSRNRWPIAFGEIPPNKWVSAEITQSQSQLIQMRFEGTLVFSYNANTPFFSIAPPSLQLGVPMSTAAVRIRHVSLTIKEYGPSTNTDGALRIRLLQLLGMLFVIAGTVMLASELLRRLIPKRAPRKNSLIKVAFGVAGVGVLADTLFFLAAHQSDPFNSYSTWLYLLSVRFSDFFQTLGSFLSHNPYGVARGTYPPFGYLLVAPFSWMSGYPALIVFESLFVGFMAWWLLRLFGAGMTLLMKFAVVAIGLLCLPTTIALDRGNTILLVFVFVILGGAALEERRGTLSAACFALAGAAKILPLGYLLVFLRKRQIRYIAFGILIAGAVTLASSFFFPGTIVSQASALRFNNDLLQQASVASTSTPFNTSIAGWIQAIGYAANGDPGGQAVANTISGAIFYEEFFGALLVIAYLVALERVEWRAMTVITCALLLFPATNSYYDLIYVFVPLAMFVHSAEVNRRTVFIACLFGLILAPKTYAFLGSRLFVDSSVLVTAPILLLLMGTAVWDCVMERKQQSLIPLPIEDQRH